jgi:hypothetical protein
MREWMYRSIFILTSTLILGEWSASRLGRFTPGDRAPDIRWTGGWVNFRARLDDLEKRKILPYWDSNSNPSGIHFVASRYTDYAIPALVCSMALVKYYVLPFVHILGIDGYVKLGAQNGRN